MSKQDSRFSPKGRSAQHWSELKNMKTSSLKTVGQKSTHSMLICQFFPCVNLQTMKAKNKIIYFGFGHREET